MHAAIDIARLASSPEERNRLYQRTRPLFVKRFGNERAKVVFMHAKEVTERVANYSRLAKQPEWAGRCVMLAAVHPLDMDAMPDLLRLFPPEERARMTSSFSRFNILRDHDESPADRKSRDDYIWILRPYTVGDTAFAPPEAFVRVVDMSQPQYYQGSGARELHWATSHGSIEEVNRNLAVSMRMVWRSYAASLLLFRCYDRQSDLAAQFLYPSLFRKVRSLLQELSGEIAEVKERFEKHIMSIISLASEKGIPILAHMDRESGESVNFTMRVKTAGSTTLKLVDKCGVDPSGADFDADRVLEDIHDLAGSTLVSEENWHAEALYHMIIQNDDAILVEHDNLFHGSNGRPNSTRDYREAGHLDYDAAAFGAQRLKRAELHVRSFRGYLDYHLSPKCGRGVRDSPIIADIFGDLNYSIVEGLGFNLGAPNGNGK